MQDAMKMQIFTTTDWNRSKNADFPIFTLFKTDITLIQEYRTRAGELNLDFSEIDLPGPNGMEVGFVMSDKQTTQLLMSYPHEKPIEPESLEEQLQSWRTKPHLTPLPGGVVLPDNCYIKIDEYFQSFADRGNGAERSGTLILIRLDTGETARVTIDFANKTYSIDRDVTGWVQVSTNADLD